MQRILLSILAFAILLILSGCGGFASSAAEKKKDDPLEKKEDSVAAAEAALHSTTHQHTHPHHASRPSPPEGVESFENLTREHTYDPVFYQRTPPVGGTHHPGWQACGFYDKPVLNEKAVHTMEHGAVWITYHPDVLPSEQVEILREQTLHHTDVIVSPYPGLPAPVVASAWGKQLRLDSADDLRLEQFVHAFEQGSQAPQSGAHCRDESVPKG